MIGRPLGNVPATEWMRVTSSASSRVSGGRMLGRRRPSIVFPAKARMAELGIAPDLNRKEVIMGKTFDPTKPEAYIQSFKIRRV